ncbi:hypothetical protein HDV00_010930 [Rhizophlyctis rosea]|nr:hypothetical protein HDV00_010930 [Rhizophlyctis rosea]
MQSSPILDALDSFCFVDTLPSATTLETSICPSSPEQSVLDDFLDPFGPFDQYPSPPPSPALSDYSLEPAYICHKVSTPPPPSPPMYNSPSHTADERSNSYFTSPSSSTSRQLHNQDTWSNDSTSPFMDILEPPPSRETYGSAMPFRGDFALPPTPTAPYNHHRPSYRLPTPHHTTPQYPERVDTWDSFGNSAPLYVHSRRTRESSHFVDRHHPYRSQQQYHQQQQHHHIHPPTPQPQSHPPPPTQQHQTQHQQSSSQPTTQSDKPKPQFPCSYPDCPRIFGRLQNLRSHLKTHTNERPYACDLCPSRFRRLPDLERHKRSIHDAAKPYVCQGCGKAYARSDALKRHTVSKSPIHGCPANRPPPPVQLQGNGVMGQGTSSQDVISRAVE